MYLLGIYKKIVFLQILFFLFGLFNNSCSYLMKNDKLTLAPKNLASSSSCLRGSRAGWNWSILTATPVRMEKSIETD